MNRRIGDISAISLSDGTYAYACWASASGGVWIYGFRSKRLITEARAFDPARFFFYAYCRNIGKNALMPIKIRIFPVVAQIARPTMKITYEEAGRLVCLRVTEGGANYTNISEEEAKGLQPRVFLFKSANADEDYNKKLQSLLVDKPIHDGEGDTVLSPVNAPFLSRRSKKEAAKLNEYERDDLMAAGKPMVIVDLEIEMPVTGDPDRRDTIEEALNDALEAADAGLVSGGEIGRKVCSLTVETTKRTKAKALTIIRSVLKKHGCPEGTTITELGEEPVAHPLVAPKKGKA